MIRSDLAVLKLLLDQGMPADAAPMFHKLGYECRHVSEIGLQKAEDEEILSCARDEGCVVITLDADFHALVAVRGFKCTLGRPASARRLQGRSRGRNTWAGAGTLSFGPREGRSDFGERASRFLPPAACREGQISIPSRGKPVSSAQAVASGSWPNENLHALVSVKIDVVARKI